MIVYRLMLRNARLFFRDRVSVFFSLLSVLIIIGLYVLFLGDLIASGMQGLGDGVRFLIDSWIMAGLFAVTSMSATLGALGIMVDDNVKKTGRDFLASPLKRGTLAVGYAGNALLVGMVLSIVTFALAELYIVANGGAVLPPRLWPTLFLYMIIAVISSSSMVFFIATFLKSANAFATVSTVIGTLIGFLTGVYIPIGQLPTTVQWLIKAFPVSHAAALFRQLMMEAPLEKVFADAPAEALASFRLELGIVLQFGDHTVTTWESLLALFATTLLFYGLAIANLSRKRR